VLDDDKDPDIQITAIHDDEGYRAVREQLAGQYNLGNREPNVQVIDIDMRGDRAIYLQHIQHNRRPLDRNTDDVMKHLHRLWGFDVHLQSIQDGRVTASYHCPPQAEDAAER
jgi:spore cortex formation protein SpoVR/YcgB (stage V sporulation)